MWGIVPSAPSRPAGWLCLFALEIYKGTKESWETIEHKEVKRPAINKEMRLVGRRRRKGGGGGGETIEGDRLFWGKSCKLIGRAFAAEVMLGLTD